MIVGGKRLSCAVAHERAEDHPHERSGEDSAHAGTSTRCHGSNGRRRRRGAAAALMPAGCGGRAPSAASAVSAIERRRRPAVRAPRERPSRSAVELERPRRRSRRDVRRLQRAAGGGARRPRRRAGCAWKVCHSERKTSDGRDRGQGDVTEDAASRRAPSIDAASASSGGHVLQRGEAARPRRSSRSSSPPTGPTSTSSNSAWPRVGEERLCGQADLREQGVRDAELSVEDEREQHALDRGGDHNGTKRACGRSR